MFKILQIVFDLWLFSEYSKLWWHWTNGGYDWILESGCSTISTVITVWKFDNLFALKIGCQAPCNHMIAVCSERQWGRWQGRSQVTGINLPHPFILHQPSALMQATYALSPICAASLSILPTLVAPLAHLTAAFLTATCINSSPNYYYRDSKDYLSRTTCT